MARSHQPGQHQQLARLTFSTTPRVHDRLTVLYDPANPSNARLDTFVNLWLAAVILAGLGALFTFFGVIFSVTGTNRISTGVRI